MKMRKKRVSIIVCLLLCATLMLTACGGEGGSSASATPAVSGQTQSTAEASSPKKTENATLNILNWGDYIAEDTIDKFEAEYPNIKLNYSTLTSNEEMLVQLTAGEGGYDICFPSDYAIEQLIRENRLMKLNKANIPNFTNMLAHCVDQDFDKGNEYSIPYMWGTVGILYNKTKVQGTVDSWNILWDKQYSKKIYMYDSLRDTIGVTLKKLGYSVNTRDMNALNEAKDALIEQKPLVLAYGTDEIKDRMAGGNATLSVVYSGDAMAAMAENEDLDYIVPKEGSNKWFDNVVVMNTCKYQDAAETFINFLCRPDISAANSEYIGYSTPSQGALDILGEEYSGSEVFNPSAETMERCEIFHDLGDFIKTYNDIWMQVKAA